MYSTKPLTEIAENLEVFCLNHACGDPVPDAGGARTRRRMNYAGHDRAAYIYICPICGKERYFGIQGEVVREVSFD